MIQQQVPSTSISWRTFSLLWFTYLFQKEKILDGIMLKEHLESISFIVYTVSTVLRCCPKCWS